MLKKITDMTHDSIYAQPKKDVPPFKFDEAVVNVFPDMIARSVPGYTLMLPLIGLIAARYAQPNSNCYDLGCSLGAVTLAMRQQIQEPDCHIIAVDSSPAMVARFRAILAEDDSSVPVEIIQADIRDCHMVRTSTAILNFTLQFITPEDRDKLVGKIYDSMLPGGALILSEKVVFADTDQNARFIEIHHDFKRAHGYSDLEISQKRTALENVLVPETIEAHQARLFSVGFQTAEVWFQAFNFVSLLAIKANSPK